MNAPLFRREVAAARRDAWLGEAQIAQPLAVRLMVAVCLALVLGILAYAILGTYTRRVHAQGLLMPDTGLITLTSPVAGRIGSAGVREGDRVERGRLLYTIDLDAVSASGPTQTRILDELANQRDAVQRQRELRAATAEAEKRALAEQVENFEAQGRQLAEQVALQEKLVPLVALTFFVVAVGVWPEGLASLSFEAAHQILRPAAYLSSVLGSAP